MLNYIMEILYKGTSAMWWITTIFAAITWLTDN